MESPRSAQRWLLLADKVEEAAGLQFPQEWAPQHNHALALEMSQRFTEALKAYSRAQTLADGNIEKARSVIGLANCYRHLGDRQRSLQNLLYAAELDGTWPQTYYLLSAHHSRMNNLEEAVRCLYEGYERSIQAGALDTLNFCQAYIADPTGLPVTLRNGAANLLDQLYSETFSQAHVRLLHRAACENFYIDRPMPNVNNQQICFVSEHFHRGSVASTFLPLLRALLELRTSVHLWSLAEGDTEDEVTDTLQHMVGGRFWRHRPPVMQAAICLDGHTGTAAALRELGERLAPLQIDYLGYPYTTGSKTIDVKVGDAFADEPGSEDAYTEKLHRIAPCMWTWEEPAQPCVRLGPSARPRILVCQNFKKVRPRFMACCHSILMDHPSATLHFKCTLLRDAHEVFHEWILPAFPTCRNRVVLEPQSPPDRLIQDLSGFSLALDTFPYSSTVTCMECLYAGLPVVTFPQHHHRGRTAGSLLHVSGLRRFMAHDTTSFCKVAGEILSMPHDELATVHEEVAHGFKKSSVFRPDVLALQFKSICLR